ncbi:MAG: acetylglutamate kinase [Ignavibacteria bacterium]
MEPEMKIAVVKISGKALNDVFTQDVWIETIKAMQEKYGGVVIVHGAGSSISEWSQALGLEVAFHEGQRVTSASVMEVVAAVQSGVLNSKIVSRLITCGLNAVGLTGIDRGSFIAENINENLGFVGIPRQTGSIKWINDLLDNKVVPVFSSLCRDLSGNLMNVNADFFTEIMAASLKADSVFFVSDVQGVKLGGSIQKLIDREKITKGISNGEITDGMIPKLNSCMELLNKGINKIWIGANNPEGINNDNDSGNGTWVVQSAC